MKVLRVVTLASATGRYGGPFDTASSQARLVGGQKDFSMLLLAGHLPDDAPVLSHATFESVVRRVNQLVARAGFSSCFSWAILAEIYRQVRRADVVHVSFARELIPMSAAITALVFRKPLIVQPHGMLTARTSRLHNAIDVVTRPIYKRAARVIALTSTEKSQLERWSRTPREGIDVIGNPLPYDTNIQEASRQKKAVFIARLESRKRVSDFVEASKLADANGWDETYEVVGPDQGEGELVREASRSIKGLSYRGPVASSEIDRILAESSVFVLTSENEPWGNVLVAALVKGLPVVVTSSAALADEIRENYLGIVVPDRDPQAVAEAVHTIVSGSWRQADEEEKANQFSSARFNQLSIMKDLIVSYTLAAEQGR